MTHKVALISLSVALRLGTSHSCKNMDTRPVCHMVCLFTPSPPPYAGTKLCCFMTDANVCVNDLRTIALAEQLGFNRITSPTP